jgi:hypothetical protein
MKTQLSKPPRRKASYTNQYKQEALELWRRSGNAAVAKTGVAFALRATLHQCPAIPARIV